LTNEEKRSERRTSDDPLHNLSSVPKRGRGISVEGPLSLRRKRNRTEAHSTASHNTSGTGRSTCSIFYFLILNHGLIWFR
jgi:hypothetical protein